MKLNNKFQKAIRYLSPKERLLAYYLGKPSNTAYDYLKKIPAEKIRNRLLSDLMFFSDDTVEFLEFVQNYLKKNQSIMVCFTAPQGVGKTISMFYLSQILTFPRIEIYTKNDFSDWLSNFQQNQTVLIPDLSVTGFTSRNWSSKIGKKIQELFSNIRITFSVVLTAIPDFEEADISIRRHFVESKVTQVENERFLYIEIANRIFVIRIPVLSNEFLFEVDKLDAEQKIKRYKQLSAEIKEILEK